jgi:hypothetical protein
VIEMVRRLLRQKLGSIGIVIALTLLGLLSVLQVATGGGEAALESGGFLALLILAAGSVSRDVSSGALQMILARPIRRVEYLYGRYCGILIAYTLYVAAIGVLALALSPLIRSLLGRTVALSAADLARGVAGALLSAALLAAVLLFFSTFLRGYGDVLAYFLWTLLLGLPETLSGPLGKPWLSRFGSVARDNLLPRVSWGDVLRGQDVFSSAVGAYVLAVTGYLALAAFVFSRREFSYGQD